jgi:hypothetical protein
MVEELLYQWYGPSDTFFKVRADDGNLYILRRETSVPDGLWHLESFRQTETRNLIGKECRKDRGINYCQRIFPRNASRGHFDRPLWWYAPKLKRCRIALERHHYALNESLKRES